MVLSVFVAYYSCRYCVEQRSGACICRYPFYYFILFHPEPFYLSLALIPNFILFMFRYLHASEYLAAV